MHLPNHRTREHYNVFNISEQLYLIPFLFTLINNDITIQNLTLKEKTSYICKYKKYNNPFNNHLDVTYNKKISTLITL